MKVRQFLVFYCGACDERRSFSEGYVYRQGKRDAVLTFKYGTPTRICLELLHSMGWAVTSKRDADGVFYRYVSKVPLPTQIRKGSLALACPKCAGVFVPPYTDAAQRTVDRLREVGGEQLAELRAEVEVLQAELAELRAPAEVLTKPEPQEPVERREAVGA